MYIGYMGDIVFSVSEMYMLTPADYEREGASRWANHDLVLRKPVSQFIGPGLEQVTFKIILHADHGISPAEQLKKLRQMRDTGAVFPLVIGGVPVTQNYWRLESLKEGGNVFNADGSLYISEPSVTLLEYDDSNGREEDALASRYGGGYSGASNVQGGF